MPKRKTSKDFAKVGRPTKMTPEVLRKLEEAFKMGCTDMEACLHAGISHAPLYDLQAKDQGFAEKKEMWKQWPVLRARTKVMRGIEDDEKLAWDFLKHKKSDEFKTKSDIVADVTTTITIKLPE